MRNPAPLVLSLSLAVAAAILIVRQPEPSKSSPAPEPATDETPAAETESVAAPPSTEQDAAWPQEASDIPADPKIVFGQLPNGMRYIILPNDEPPDRVSVRLHIAAGSLMESDEQQGLAHFLEHMVFNGSKHFTSAEIVPQMQRLGIAFGAHVNAYTSFDETVYMLDLPDLSDKTTDLAFTVMRDFADGALLDAEEIDKERGVILSEMTSRDSIGYRIMKKQFGALLPDSLLTRRFPIGEEEIIRNAPRERFVDFYSRYYVPSRMTFVVVGSIEAEAMRKRIESTFGSMSEPSEPGADPPLGDISPAEEKEPLVLTDKELPGTELGLLWIKPYKERIDNRETRTEDMRLSLAHAMLGRRFDRISKQPDSPILSGSASAQELFRYVTIGSVDVTVTKDRLDDAVVVLENEFRRASEHGFTAAELAEAKANVLNYFEQQVANRESRLSNDLATEIVQSINSESVLSSPETDLEVAREILGGMTPDDCHQAYLGFWSDARPQLILTAKEAPDDVGASLSASYEEAGKMGVAAPEEAEMKSFAYTDFGTAGEVASEEVHEDLGITTLKLSNGITVNFKQTDFDKNRISLLARIGNGRLLMPSGKKGLAEFASAVVNEGGIGEHSAEELRQILAGRNVGTGFGIEDNYFSLAGTTTPDDLQLQLQLMAAQILHPGMRQEAIDQFRRSVPMMLQQLNHTTDGAMQEMFGWLHGNDPRFEFPREEEVLLAYTAEDIATWLAEDFTAGQIELNLAGDFDPEATLPLILSTFGALPQRPAAGELPEDVRKVNFPSAPQQREITYDSRIEKAQAIIVWSIPGPRGNEEELRRFNLLADILADRLREEIREKLGASYSPASMAGGSRGLDDFGFLLTLSTGKPDDMEKLTEATLRMASELASKGATEDELNRARTPLLSELDRSLRENSYWLGSVLNGSTEDPRRLDLARSRIEDVKSITLDEINQLASRYLADDKAIMITIVPSS